MKNYSLLPAFNFKLKTKDTMVNFNRYFYGGFKKYKPFDIAVIISLNVIVGIYIWAPFIKEMQSSKKGQIVNETIKSDTFSKLEQKSSAEN